MIMGAELNGLWKVIMIKHVTNQACYVSDLDKCPSGEG